MAWKRVRAFVLDKIVRETYRRFGVCREIAVKPRVAFPRQTPTEDASTLSAFRSTSPPPPFPPPACSSSPLRRGSSKGIIDLCANRSENLGKFRLANLGRTLIRRSNRVASDVFTHPDARREKWGLTAFPEAPTEWT